jgi:hypothetical protein
MRVVGKPWYHVPVEVGNSIAEAREIHFQWFEVLPHDRLDRENDAHQVQPIVFGKIGHFSYVRFPDHATKTGVAGFGDVYNPAPLVLPEQLSAGSSAQLASHRVF